MRSSSRSPNKQDKSQKASDNLSHQHWELSNVGKNSPCGALLLSEENIEDESDILEKSGRSALCAFMMSSTCMFL